jgi:hypothetical protein
MPVTRPVRRGAAVATVVALAAALPATAAVVDHPLRDAAPGAALSLEPIGTYETGVFDESAAEIVAFHARSQRVFTVNADAGAVDVLDVADPTVPTKVGAFVAEGALSGDGSVVPAGAVANSLSVREDGLGVVAVEHPVKTEDGWLVFFDANAAEPAALGAVRVGALPDMVAVSDDGRWAVVANEGEPAEDFGLDPEGSVGVVALPRAVAAPSQEAVRIADFRAFDADGALPDGVRVFGPVLDPERRVSTNLEPEYVTISGSTAYVSLQEANAIAVVDVPSATVTRILPLGWKDHGVPGAGLDPSDRDGRIDIRTVAGLRGLYLPDAVESFTTRGRTYLVTANEGDAREWGEYEEGARVGALGRNGLPPVCADSPLAALTGNADLGRLNVTLEDGLREDGSCFENLYSFGARSFSIWTTDGERVFDSGDELERVIARTVPEAFNSNHSETNLEGRSDDKGPEPEGVTIGEVRGRTYAFIGLERIGGVMVYDVTVPAQASFVTYVNNRDVGVSVEDDGVASLSAAGDLGAEGLTFVPQRRSPSGSPLLVVGNEVSGTTTLFEVGSLVGRGVDRRPGGGR